MRIIILPDDSIRGGYSKSNRLEPMELPDGTFMVPERILENPAFSEIHQTINENKLRVVEILDLPEVGEEVTEGNIYKYSTTDLDGNPQEFKLVCKQTHIRIEEVPENLPDYFVI